MGDISVLEFFSRQKPAPLGWVDESAYLEAMMYFVFDPPTEKK